MTDLTREQIEYTLRAVLPGGAVVVHGDKLRALCTMALRAIDAEKSAADRLAELDRVLDEVSAYAEEGMSVHEVVRAAVDDLDRTRAELAAAKSETAAAVSQAKHVGDCLVTCSARAAAAEAELAAARAAMPTADVKDTIAWASGWCRTDMTPKRHDALRDWLARLSAYHAAHPAASADAEKETP